MKRLLLLTALVAACAPSRSEMLSPIQEAVRHRIAQNVDWRGETKEDSAVDAAVKKLLASELTEDGAVQVALLRNRGLQGAYESLGISQAALVQAGLLANPVFSGRLGFSGDKTSPDFEIGVEEDFLSLLFLPSRVSFAESNVTAARARTTARVVDVASGARRAFVDVVAAHQLYALRSTVAEAAEAAWDLAKRQHDAGNTTDLEWMTQQARYKEAVLALADAERDARIAREHVNAALGLFGAETAWTVSSGLLEAPLDDAAQKAKLEHLENKAVAASLSLSSMRAEMDALASRLGYENARRFIPTLDVGVGADRDDGNFEVGPRASVALPIFDMGQGEVLAAESRLRMRGEEYASRAVEVRAHARELLVRAQNADDRARYIKAELLPLRESLVEEAQKNYNGMLIGAFVLLDARKNQVETGVEYVEALRTVHRTRIEIEALLAGGDVAMPVDTSRSAQLVDDGEGGGR